MHRRQRRQLRVHGTAAERAGRILDRLEREDVIHLACGWLLRENDNKGTQRIVLVRCGIASTVMGQNHADIPGPRGTHPDIVISIRNRRQEAKRRDHPLG